MIRHRHNAPGPGHRPKSYLPVAWIALLTLVPAAHSASALDPDKAVSQYISDYWTVEDGLPQLSVHQILQSPDGYIWVSTEEGLGRFDGVRFEVFDRSNTPAIADSVFSGGLSIAPDGALWAGSNAGVLRIHGSEMRRYGTADGLSHERVHTVLAEEDGVWIGTEENLNLLADGRITVLGERDGLPDPTVAALARDAAGSLWIATTNGLCRLRDGEIETVPAVPGLPTGAIWTLHAARDGILWVGAQSGLSRFDGRRFTTYPPQAGFRSITAVTDDADGNVWVGSYGLGLSRITGEEIVHYREADGLPGDLIGDLHVDREGSLWVGLIFAGLLRLTDGVFTTYSSAEGLAHDVTYSVYEDHRGDLWIGTGGGLNRFRDGVFTTYTEADGLVTNKILPLVEDPEGTLWIATSGGLSRLRDGRIEPYPIPGPWALDDVTALYVDRGGALWMGGNGGIKRLQDGVITTFPVGERGLRHDRAYYIHQDREGTLWFATLGGGLVRFDGEAFTHYTTADGLANDVVLTIHEDAEGTLWLATWGGGLSRFRDGRFTTFSTRDGLPDDKFFRILEDDQGYLWMSYNKGIMRVGRSDLDAYAADRTTRLPVTVYDRADGMKSAEASGGTQPAGWRARDGRLWFTTTRGVSVVDPARAERRIEPPPVVLEQMRIDNQPVELGESVVVAPGWLHLELVFTAPSFRAPEKIRFRYRLEGYDEDWVTTDARKRFAQYSNLDPDTYRFRVEASHDGLEWTPQGAALEIVVLPPLWRTWWAYCLYALILGAGIAAYLHAHRKEIERERKISARLREIDQLKDEFLANTSHELRTPLYGMVGIAESLIDGATGELPEATRAHLAMIVSSGRRLGGLVDDVLDFSKLRHDSLELVRQPVELHALTDVVLTLSRPLAGDKNLELRNAVSPSLPPAHADENRVQQILLNLVGNAIKFTETGFVEVTAGFDPDGDGQLEVRVTDTGIGIPEQQQARIFESFVQADASTERAYRGSGLGLAVTRQLVELHGDRLRVESAPGRGSTFFFTLPASTEKASDAVPAVERSAVIRRLAPGTEEVLLGPGGNGSPNAPRLLVVDDEPVIRQVLTNHLAAESYRLIQAASGPEALNILDQEELDLVLLDVMMPKMSGYEVCRLIRERHSLQQLPVI
ncbi:MAG: response regulator, partial [bacterium]|nr:response regulator [bacterium]